MLLVLQIRDRRFQARSQVAGSLQSFRQGTGLHRVTLWTNHLMLTGLDHHGSEDGQLRHLATHHSLG
jgi:hypothetical protein